MPSKKAILIGCNYDGTNAKLNGCINDVIGMKAMLTTYMGFTESEITVMIDTDKATLQPTGKNIKAKLNEMVASAQDNDILVVHFSGHGTQVPSDSEAGEADGKDEAICPCDMNLITDDDLRAIFQPLANKPTVKLTFIADCCHSGSLLDHDQVIITGPKSGGPPPPNVDAQAIQNMLAALGAGPQRDFKNRALPFAELCTMLSQMLGKPVQQGNVREGLGSLFGADASVKVQQYMKYAQMAQTALTAVQRDGAAGGFQALCGILTACMGSGGAAGGANETPAGGAGGAGAAYAVADPGNKPPPAGAKPSDKLNPDVGILITGCQDKETSADACPSGDKTKAFGALSNALQTTVKTHYTQNPNTPITSRNLVIGVREMLAKTNFAQNPCLECSEKHADEAFIVR